MGTSPLRDRGRKVLKGFASFPDILERTVNNKLLLNRIYRYYIIIESYLNNEANMKFLKKKTTALAAFLAISGRDRRQFRPEG